MAQLGDLQLPILVVFLHWAFLLTWQEAHYWSAVTRFSAASRLLSRTHFSGSAAPLPSFLSFRAMHGLVHRVEATQQQLRQLPECSRFFDDRLRRLEHGRHDYSYSDGLTD